MSAAFLAVGADGVAAHRPTCSRNSRLTVPRNRAQAPIGAASSFANVERLYFFTEIVDAGENVVIQHVWYYKDEPLLNVALTVNGPRWRTWSHKNITGMKGPWRTDVVNSKGDVLESVSFTVD